MRHNQSSFKGKDIVQVLSVTVLVIIGWLLFSGNIQTQEVIAAASAGLITGLSGYALRRRRGHRQYGLMLWIRHAPTLLLGALVDSWTVTVALFHTIRGRPSRGGFHRYTFRAMGDDPHEVARRVLVTIGTTLQPNTYVVGFNKQSEEILLHELVPTREIPIAEDLRGEQ